MMDTPESRIVKFKSRNHADVVPIKTVPGHFATSHSHTNFYIDLTTLKARQKEAAQCAKALAGEYLKNNMIIDTIVCLDGTDVIGAFLAEELTEAGVRSSNAHQTIYVIHPEQIARKQFLFRENMESMLRGKNVLLLMASITTGTSIHSGTDCIRRNGGLTQGIAAIFSALPELDGLKINAVFDTEDIKGYASYSRKRCPFCEKGIPVEALVNAYGYTKL